MNRPSIADDPGLPNVTGALVDQCGNLVGISLADDVQTMEPAPATRYQWRDALLNVFGEMGIPLREFDCSAREAAEPEAVAEEPEPEEPPAPEPLTEPEEQPGEHSARAAHLLGVEHELLHRGHEFCALHRLAHKIAHAGLCAGDERRQ